MKTLTVKIPDLIANKLDNETAKQQTSRSYVVREALAEYLIGHEENKTAAASFLDLANDLCGCTKGPADLSTHDKHMEDYGD